MVYKCLVKHNGVDYPAGTDVPVGEKPVVAEDKNEAHTTYTKTVINKMSVAELRELSKKEGLDDTLLMKELKHNLIEHFSL